MLCCGQEPLLAVSSFEKMSEFGQLAKKLRSQVAWKRLARSQCSSLAIVA